MEKKSDYQISSSVNDGILEIVLTGKLIASDLEGLQNEIADIVKAKEVKNLLVDSRALYGRIGIFESYTTARRPLPDRVHMNTAIVDRPENEDIQSFLETTSVNVGWSHKWFTDIEKARDWLEGKISKVNTDNL